MKKFMKGCGITALILIVLGAGFATVASGFRGRTFVDIREVVRAITGDRWDWHLDSGYYDIDEADFFDAGHKITKGNVKKYSLGSGMTNLEVEIGGCELYVTESQDSDFYLEAKNAKKLQAYVEGNTLYVKAIRSAKVWEDIRECQITLYVPDGYFFEEADLEVGAGYINVEKLHADEINLEVGAGNIEVDDIGANKIDVNVGAGAASLYDMQAGDFNGDVGVGYLYAEGQIGMEADLTCAMGSIEVLVSGEWTDFNYDIECDMGSIELEGDGYSGFAHERTIDNKAAKNMDLECSMGSVLVNFN